MIWCLANILRRIPFFARLYPDQTPTEIVLRRFLDAVFHRGDFVVRPRGTYDDRMRAIVDGMNKAVERYDAKIRKLR